MKWKNVETITIKGLKLGLKELEKNIATTVFSGIV